MLLSLLLLQSLQLAAYRLLVLVVMVVLVCDGSLGDGMVSVLALVVTVFAMLLCCCFVVVVASCCVSVCC